MKIRCIPHQEPEIAKVDRMERVMDLIGRTIGLVTLLALAEIAVRWGWGW